jgi:predicted DNA-binding transcriptional regulator YafY
MNALETKADRLLQIETLLLNRPGGMSVTEIAHRLGVNRTTVWRYWNSGSLTRRGIVMEDDGNLRLDRAAHQVQIKINLHEAMAVHLAIRMLASRSDRRNPHAASAVRKLGGALAQSTPAVSRFLKQTADGMDDPAQWTDPVFVAVLEALTEAWATGHKLRVLYRSKQQAEAREYVFAPYFIEPYAIGQSTHVIGWREPPDALRTFKIERIERAELLADCYTIPEDFDPQVLLQDAWGIWFTGDPPEEVVLRFHPSAASRVQESRWHRSQQIELQPDGYLVWRARIAAPQEMLNWIQGWGAGVEVLQPAWLREAVIAEVRRLAEMYAIRESS